MRLKTSCIEWKNIQEEIHGFIYEASQPYFRDIVGSDNFYDVLQALKPGNMITFGYISNAKIEVPKGKRLNPSTNRMNQFDDYEQLGKNLGEEEKVVNVIKLTIYNMPWQSQQKISDKYTEWSKNRDELYDRFGVQRHAARYKTQTNNFGKNGGVNQYDGQNDALKKHSYANLNMSDIKPINTTYYLVTEAGNLKPVEQSKLTFQQQKYVQNAIERLKNNGATNADVQCLMGFDYRRFEHSSILFISATLDNGIPTLLINDKLTDKIGGATNISTQNLVNIAKERYKRFL